ncbi:hypothetical protein DFJ74DRAFT_49278 [Hyaloraphidium curvatum]|nr:hypothetical protein DFJ74DRAFT_49278 [Hyaloraphidium curvatum]
MNIRALVLPAQRLPTCLGYGYAPAGAHRPCHNAIRGDVLGDGETNCRDLRPAPQRKCPAAVPGLRRRPRPAPLGKYPALAPGRRRRRQQARQRKCRAAVAGLRRPLPPAPRRKPAPEPRRRHAGRRPRRLGNSDDEGRGLLAVHGQLGERDEESGSVSIDVGKALFRRSFRAT